MGRTGRVGRTAGLLHAHAGSLPPEHSSDMDVSKAHRVCTLGIRRKSEPGKQLPTKADVPLSLHLPPRCDTHAPVKLGHVP